MGIEQQAGSAPGEDQAWPRLRRALLASALVLVVLILGAAMTRSIPIQIRPDFALAMFFAIKQDIPVGAVVLVVVLALRFVLEPRASARPPAAPLRLKGWAAWAVLLAPALCAWLLRAQILPDYDMSRDEQMVTFDAAIYASGRLFATIPPSWRHYYDALNATFLLPIGDREAWVSNYLPGNAAIRALLGFVLPQAAHGAVLLLVATLALWRIVARLWPESPGTRAVVLLLFASSSQILVTAATTYAMTAHLALNCVWLWLFLQRTPRGHAAAIAIGFVATGLHQPLFHPMFVAPFLLLLLRERAWKELAAYVACYGAIGLFWLGWQPWVAGHAFHSIPLGQANGGVSLLDRFRDTMPLLPDGSFAVMAANLLRFVSWNHLLLVPLMLLTLARPLHRDRMVQSLWLGMLLLVGFMTLFLAAQVNGWGYRYLHGFLVSAVLLCGYAWHWLEQRGAAPVRSMAALTALGLVVVLPLHVWMARAQMGSYAEAARFVRTIDADVAIVDEGVPFAGDLVINTPDLANRPILLMRRFVEPGDLAGLCAGRTIAFADAPRFGSVSAFFGLPQPTRPTRGQQALHQAAVEAGCLIAPAGARAPGFRP